MSKNLKVALVVVLVAAVAVVGFFYKEHKDSEATLSTTQANVAVHTPAVPAQEEHAAMPTNANEAAVQPTTTATAPAPAVTTNAPVTTAQVVAQPAPAAQTATAKK